MFENEKQAYLALIHFTTARQRDTVLGVSGDVAYPVFNLIERICVAAGQLTRAKKLELENLNYKIKCNETYCAIPAETVVKTIQPI